MPTPEAFEDVVRDQKLDAVQARELRLILGHLDLDLKTYRERRSGEPPRPELVRFLKRVAKALDDLENELRRYATTLNQFLPPDAREEIGALMSLTEIESALGIEIPTPELKATIDELAAEDPEFRLAQLEDRLLYRRQARGLERGGDLLLHIVERVNRPVQAWVDLDRRNRGGRPTKDLARDLLLYRLAEAAPVVIGRRPTATAGGAFVRLCAAVTTACGLDDVGIERAAEKAIKALSSHLRKGFKPTPSSAGARSNKPS